MIGVGAVITVAAGKVDTVNAGDEFSNFQEFLIGTGFHCLMFTPEERLRSWGVHPIGEAGSWRILTFINMTKTTIRPSTLILTCLVAFTLASLVGCADNDRHSSTSDSSSTTMSADTKDMTHRSNQNSH